MKRGPRENQALTQRQRDYLRDVAENCQCEACLKRLTSGKPATRVQKRDYAVSEAIGRMAQ